MFGAIMPAPLAMPVTVTVVASTSMRRERPWARCRGMSRAPPRTIRRASTRRAARQGVDNLLDRQRLHDHAGRERQNSSGDNPRLATARRCRAAASPASPVPVGIAGVISSARVGLSAQCSRQTITGRRRPVLREYARACCRARALQQDVIARPTLDAVRGRAERDAAHRKQLLSRRRNVVDRHWFGDGRSTCANSTAESSPSRPPR